MNSTKRWLMGVLAVTASMVSLQVDAALPAAITGAWYNPSQSGHGLTIQVLNPQRALVFWHAFDNHGDPLTLYIEGDIKGRQIHGLAYAPKGMVFGEFDPRALELPVWGEVTLRFDSCRSAELSWQPQQADYSAGQMRIEQLAAVDPARCDLPSAPDALPAGLYQGVTEPGPYSGASGVGVGVVDGEGRLWAMEIFHPQVAPAGEVPGPNWQDYLSGRLPPYEAPPRAVVSLPQLDGSAATVLAPNDALTGAEQYLANYQRPASWDAQGLSISLNASGHQRWSPASGPQTLRAPLSSADLVGTYQVPFDANHDPEPGRLTIDAAGALCLQPADAVAADCLFRGQIWWPDADLGLFDFELQRRDGMRVRNLQGRGWLVDGPQGRLLYMVAVAPTGALGLVAY